MSGAPGGAVWASGQAPGWYEVPGGWSYFDGYAFVTSVSRAPGPDPAPVVVDPAPVGGAGAAGGGPREASDGVAGGPAGPRAGACGGRRARVALVVLGTVTALALVVFGAVMVTVRPFYTITPEQAWAACVDQVRAGGEVAGDEVLPEYSELDVLVTPVADRARAWRVRTYVQAPDRRRAVVCVVETVERRAEVVEWSVAP